MQRERLTDIERRKAQEKAEKTLKPGFAVLDAKGKQVDVDVDQGKAQKKPGESAGQLKTPSAAITTRFAPPILLTA
jgi:hypothetical protein